MLRNDKRKIGENVGELCKSGLLSKHSACIKSTLETSQKIDEDLVEYKVVNNLKTKEDLSPNKITLHFLPHDKTDEISVEATKTCLSK